LSQRRADKPQAPHARNMSRHNTHEGGNGSEAWASTTQ
jgi:hypothetical protein